MNKNDQESFYLMVGKSLTKERGRRNITIAQLAKRSGEQTKTIKGIESGRPCSLHHVVWLVKVLGIDINEIIGGNSGEESSIGIDDII